MTMGAINEVFTRFRQEYWRGSKKEKGALLDSVCKTTGLHRKAAIRKFDANQEPRGKPQGYGRSMALDE
jgi:hypothetical protein